MEKFQMWLTGSNRMILVLLIIGLGSMFYFPIPEGVSEQMVGFLQGLMGAIVLRFLDSSERQTDHWFQKNDDII